MTTWHSVAIITAVGLDDDLSLSLSLSPGHFLYSGCVSRDEVFSWARDLPCKPMLVVGYVREARRSTADVVAVWWRRENSNNPASRKSFAVVASNHGLCSWWW